VLVQRRKTLKQVVHQIRPASGPGDVQSGVHNESFRVGVARAAGQPGTWRDDEAVRGHVERVDDRAVTSESLLMAIFQLWFAPCPGAQLAGVFKGIQTSL
jgi:hypothetical protein